jgi:hypothetical protein
MGVGPIPNVAAVYRKWLHQKAGVLALVVKYPEAIG